MYIRLLLLLAVGTTLVLSACGGGGGDPRPDLLFVSTRDGDYAIYAMDADGARQKRLTRTEVDTSSPAGLFFQIDPAWSPDGAKIAFASRRAGSSDIYVMRADGTGTQRLTATRVDDTHPTWAPDGTADRVQARRRHLRHEARTALRRTDLARHGIRQRSRMVSGRQMDRVTRRLSGTQEREIWIMRPDGSDPGRLTSLRGSSINPAWSPDGSTDRLRVEHRRLALRPLSGRGRGKRVHRLDTGGPDTFGPAWSPDGSTIAFSQDGAISTTDLKGQSETLTDTTNNDRARRGILFDRLRTSAQNVP